MGWLTAQQPSSLAPFLDALRAGLAEYGYQEGHTLLLEYRYANDVLERVPALADELVRLPVDLLVAQGAAVYEISGRPWPVPIVYVISADPVSSGFATSLARPLGNMTGVTLMATEFNAKRLELLREIMPTLRKVAILGNSEHPGAHLEQRVSEETGRRLGFDRRVRADPQPGRAESGPERDGDRPAPGDHRCSPMGFPSRIGSPSSISP